MELTSTEYRIAEQVALGYSEKQIADRLCISPKTVSNHKYNILRKNNLKNMAEMVREFVLNLENPRKYFSAILMLFIQLFAVFTMHSQPVRRAPRMLRHHKIFKIHNKNS